MWRRNISEVVVCKIVMAKFDLNFVEDGARKPGGGGSTWVDVGVMPRFGRGFGFQGANSNSANSKRKCNNENRRIPTLCMHSIMITGIHPLRNNAYDSLLLQETKQMNKY